MSSFAGQFIFICWAIFIIVWMVASFRVKRTVEKKAGWWRIQFLLIAAIIFFFLRYHDLILWSYTLVTGMVADIITLVGLIIALWARITLGGNWSTATVLKENHELITNGPYSYVRHPIYSGLLLMVFGTAIFFGHVAVFVAFALSAVAAWFRALEEEKLLTKRFPEAYPKYKQDVKAFIPFVF